MRKQWPGEVVSGEFVFLRRVVKEDLRVYFRWYRDPELQRFMANPNWNPRLSECDYRGIFLRRHLLQTGNNMTFTICLTAERSPVGLVELFEIDRGSGCCEIGVVVGEKGLWRKGIATAAVKLAADYAFSTM